MSGEAYPVRCTAPGCGWTGSDDEVLVDVEGPVLVELCPRCGSDKIENARPAGDDALASLVAGAD